MQIKASSTISHQPTFRRPGFSAQLSALKNDGGILAPDYSAFIPAMERRRMSDVLKMAVACSFDCLEQARLVQPGAIVVGTSMGCAAHTKHFLENIRASGGGLISPTAFILSTHNTIAGQISLLLKNHGHNMTHTQNSLSFEHALIDAMLCLENGCGHVLVGAADEAVPELFNMGARLNIENVRPVSGASFFILADEKTNDRAIELVDVGSFGLIKNLSGPILELIKSNKLSPDDIGLVLFSSSHQNTNDELEMIFGPRKLFDFQALCGTYLTNSAFAMHFGADFLSQAGQPVFGKKTNTVLVCNNLVPENLGLILLTSPPSPLSKGEGEFGGSPSPLERGPGGEVRNNNF